MLTLSRKLDEGACPLPRNDEPTSCHDAETPLLTLEGWDCL